MIPGGCDPSSSAGNLTPNTRILSIHCLTGRIGRILAAADNENSHNQTANDSYVLRTRARSSSKRIRTRCSGEARDASHSRQLLRVGIEIVAEIRVRHSPVLRVAPGESGDPQSIRDETCKPRDAPVGRALALHRRAPTLRRTLPTY
jgi:hypothetical protein